MKANWVYRAYRFFYGMSSRLERHFTSAGTLLTAVFATALLFGFNMFKTTLYQLLALCAACFALSLTAGLVPFRIRVRVARNLPKYATVGQTLSYDVDITNLSEKTRKGLFLFEDLADPRPDVKTFLTRKEPRENLRNAWDRKMKYYRWTWLIRRSAKITFEPVPLPDLPPGGTVRITLKGVPFHRGYIHFTGCTFARPDPLGLFMRLFSVNEPDRLLILPERYDLTPPDLLSRRQYHPGGVNLASSIGNSDEFMSLRYYRPGDPLRNIHWRTFARTDQLVIKEFEDEFFVRQALILDTFTPADREEIFEEAVRVAASYAASVQTSESIMDLVFMGRGVQSFATGRGLADSESLLEILACVEPCQQGSIRDLSRLIEGRLNQISGAVCILTDWDENYAQFSRIFEHTRTSAFMIVLAEDLSAMKHKIARTREAAPWIRVVQSGRVERDLARP